MPSVPSRLAAVCACALTLGISAPALADKGPRKTPPQQPSGLESPGHSSHSGAGDGIAPQMQTVAEAPSTSTGGSPGSGFTRKTNKGKGHGEPTLSPDREKGGNGTSFTPKQSKGRNASPAQATQTSAGSTPSPTSSSTPVGGSTATPLPTATRTGPSASRTAIRSTLARATWASSPTAARARARAFRTWRAP